jgi:hypothetical protein
MREQFTEQLKVAMKAGNKRRVDTLRMINAGLKDRDIEARGTGKLVSDEDILALLQKMVKTRQESLAIYSQAGRTDLADQEREEIAIISEFLPQPLSEDDVKAAITAAIAETGAAGVKDMGKVIGLIKTKFPGQIDAAKASGLVKAMLTG